MTTHDTILQLAAMAIDDSLSPADRGRLEAHLAGCPACVRSAAGLRADAMAIASLPGMTLPERRGAEILAAAMHPAAVRPSMRLVGVAALLALLLLGALAAGAELLRRLDDGDLAIVLPVPTSTAEPSPSPTTEPSVVTPSPTATAFGERLGDVWTAATLPVGEPTGVVEAVTAGGPGFVAVGRGCVGDTRCQGIVWLSEDGQTWTRAPASSATEIGSVFLTSGPELGMFDVAAGDPGIVAIGYAAMPTIGPTTWFSQDGVTWERRSFGDRSARVQAVSWDGRAFVMVGEDRSDLQVSDLATAQVRAAVWTSTDGRTWARVPHTAALDAGGFVDTLEDPASGGMRDVAAGPDGVIAVGSVCTAKPAGCVPAIWTSRDGITWTRVADAPSTPGVLKAVAASDSGYVAVGRETCGSSPIAIPRGCTALVLTSADGVAWSQQPFPQAGDIRTVTRIGDHWLATTPDGLGTLWTSDDGTSWAIAALDGGPETGSYGGGTSGWHLAATPTVAVWLGTLSDIDGPMAWVSRR